eukprot:332636_1
MADRVLKVADKRSKYCVFGYCLLVEQTQLLKHIPTSIKSLCLTYYFIHELFTKHGEFIQTNETQDTAQYKSNHNDSDLTAKDLYYMLDSGEYNTIYGNVNINPSDKSINKYAWTFKVLKYEYDWGFYIGIDSSNKSFSNADFTVSAKNHNPYFAFTASGYTYNNGKVSNLKGQKWHAGDFVEMIFDVTNKKLTLRINGKTEGIILNVKVQNIQYHLAIVMSNEGHQIKLLKFQQEYQL